jgi:hypothetical protein
MRVHSKLEVRVITYGIIVMVLGLIAIAKDDL